MFWKGGVSLRASVESKMDHYDNFRRTKAFSSLDGLRCLSIVGVILAHTLWNVQWWLPALRMGYLGVDFFFVISGFLIVTLLLRERERTGDISLRKFYARRTLRIFPLYYGVIFALAIFSLVRKDTDFAMHFWGDFPYYLTYTANLVIVHFLILWSLSTEEQFYVIWPSIEKYFPKHGVVILAVLLLINQFINFPQGRALLAAAIGKDQWTNLHIAQVTFTPILLGVTAAHLLHSKRGFNLLRFVAGSRWASACWFLIMAGVLSVCPVYVTGFSRLVIHVCMAFLLISCVWREDHVMKPLLATYPMQRIGQISYGMYLMHVFAIHAARVIFHYRQEDTSIWYFIAVLIITIVLAEFSFRFYETPFLKLKRKYSVVHQSHV